MWFCRGTTAQSEYVKQDAALIELEAWAASMYELIDEVEEVMPHLRGPGVAQQGYFPAALDKQFRKVTVITTLTTGNLPRMHLAQYGLESITVVTFLNYVCLG